MATELLQSESTTLTSHETVISFPIPRKLWKSRKHNNQSQITSLEHTCLYMPIKLNLKPKESKNHQTKIKNCKQTSKDKIFKVLLSILLALLSLRKETSFRIYLCFRFLFPSLLISKALQWPRNVVPMWKRRKKKMQFP